MILLKRLFSLAKTRGVKFGLENSQKLDEALNFPSQSFASIHVAGTNGKGSVTTKIAASLRGLKVGLYTSPHISTFRERIQIDGAFITEAQAEEVAKEVFVKVDHLKIEPTFFEVMTLMAFLYFAKQKVDVAIIEVGMGGRLDSTNIVTPLLSIITSIGLDHTLFLGKTVEAIASEKAGIIKESVPVLVGPKAAFEVIRQVAKEMNSPYYAVEGEYGSFEEENNAIVRKALTLLPFQYDLRGLDIIPPCRFEIFETTVLDVAHNVAALKALFDRVERTFPGKKVRLLVGLSEDKDLTAMLDFLSKRATFIHLCKAAIPRGASTIQLATILSEDGFTAFSEEVNVKEGFLEAKKRLQKDELLVVTGTFYIMKEVRSALGIFEPSDSFETPY